MSGSVVTRAASLVADVPSGVGVASALTLTPVDRERLLPVHGELAGLFPSSGLRRGGTVAVRGSTTLLLALLAAATADGSWAAVVGMPGLGVLAAAELGVEVRRLALIPHPGPELGAVTAALLDGMDLVAVVGGSRIDASRARRLSARARHRGSVLIPFGSWPGADLELACVGGRWTGLGDGHGHLRVREVVVHARGRGAAAKPVRVSLLLPGHGGVIEARIPEQARGIAVPRRDVAG